MTSTLAPTPVLTALRLASTFQGEVGERLYQAIAADYPESLLRRPAQLVALNAGVAMMAVAAALGNAPALAWVGTLLALTGGATALGKAWAFPALGRSERLARRGRRVWDPGSIGGRSP